MITFIENHYRVGELFMEYIRHGCTEKGNICEFCREKPWVGPPMSRIPQPIPLQTGEYHYEDVFNTTNHKGDGTLREIDDFAPRANLKQLFKADQITSKDHEAINKFAIDFIVDVEAVTTYVRHMEELKTHCWN